MGFIHDALCGFGPTIVACRVVVLSGVAGGPAAVAAGPAAAQLRVELRRRGRAWRRLGRLRCASGPAGTILVLFAVVARVTAAMAACVTRGARTAVTADLLRLMAAGAAASLAILVAGIAAASRNGRGTPTAVVRTGLSRVTLVLVSVPILLVPDTGRAVPLATATALGATAAPGRRRVMPTAVVGTGFSRVPFVAVRGTGFVGASSPTPARGVAALSSTAGGNPFVRGLGVPASWVSVGDGVFRAVHVRLMQDRDQVFRHHGQREGLRCVPRVPSASRAWR